MTRVDIWVARRPDDIFIDRLNARLNVKTMTAAERRTAMDGLIRHVVVDSAKPATGECNWCPTRRQLATMPDGAQRMPGFGKRMMSPTHRRVLGEPCGRCIRAALGVVSRRVHAGRTKNSGDATRSTTNKLDAGGRHHVNRVASSDLRNKKHHDPFGTCTTCREHLGTHPDAALTASGVPEGCPRHAWNEKPRPPKWAR
ncbi:MAG TPA: hypothetical protein VFH23_13055 [Jiangellaceae bacterium]|nr:hypothetical protein [Jiangellaceae bacterium]